jgi:small subunit ribosomal protein S20
MANHKSAIKRIRSNEKKRLANRYYAKTMRTMVKKFRSLKDRKAAEEQLPQVFSVIDKLAKKTIIHKNKAANLKGKLARKVNSL